MTEIKGKVTKKGHLRNYKYGYKIIKKFYIQIEDEQGELWNVMVEVDDERINEYLKLNIGDIVEVSSQKVKDGNWLSVTLNRKFKIVNHISQNKWEIARERYYKEKEKWHQENDAIIKKMKDDIKKVSSEFMESEFEKRMGVIGTKYKIVNAVKGLTALNNMPLPYGKVGQKRFYNGVENVGWEASTGLCSAISDLPDSHRRSIVKFMLDNGLIYYENDYYYITDKGREFIQVYKEIRESLNDIVNRMWDNIPVWDKRIRDFLDE